MIPPTERWEKLFYHEQQWKLWNTKKRFIVAACGRRSGKSELAKRKLLQRAFAFKKRKDGRFFFAAPVYHQAKDIYWEDLKALTPVWMQERNPSESDLTVFLKSGTRITVVGMDKPHRIEGTHIDGIVMDEFAKMKEAAWTLTVRPMLSTLGREGWAMFIGTPKGRNHFYEMYNFAKIQDNQEWICYTWPSRDILDASEIEQAKNDLDELSFMQEYEASFITFAGRAYYTFERESHAIPGIPYYATQPLILCFDFNKSPGTCAVVQEQPYEGERRDIAKQVTAAIGEIWVKKNSNTPLVCQKIIKQWGGHQGQVIAYGDSTGGITGTQSAHVGSDWDQIETILGRHFGQRFYIDIPKQNPRERIRVNAFNSRIRNYSGMIHFIVDKDKCPHLIQDLEGVALKDDGSGKIEKIDGDPLTHISDGVGYYIVREFPVIEPYVAARPVF